jgi:hypothetical protein
MMRDVVDRLLHVEADHVVTITAPLDRRRPGNDEDRIRIRNLLAGARTEVASSVDASRAEPLLEGLDAATAAVALDAGAQGVVIVVTPELAETHLLPFPVAESVTVGATPATRFLVQGLRRSPRYRLLVVSDRATRLFEAVRDDVSEVATHGFPLSADIVPRDRRATAGRFARSPGRDDKEQWRNFYRTVDQALTDAAGDDPLPIVLAGVNSSTSLFLDVSRNAELVIGRLDGAHDRASTHQLGQAAWPILREHLEMRRRAVVADLGDALHAGDAVVGIDDVWQYARQGRGRLVVVEEDYRAQPSREVDGRLVPTTSAAPDVMADPVDELIEHVIRGGGSAEFVGPDALARLGRIGLLLR